MLDAVLDVFFPQNQPVIGRVQRHSLVACEDLMPPVVFVPLGERGRHVHLFDDVAPAHARIVSAE